MQRATHAPSRHTSRLYILRGMVCLLGLLSPILHAQKILMLSEEHTDAPIRITQKNQELVLKLKTNPSTGYSWKIIETGEPVLTLQKSWQEDPRSQPSADPSNETNPQPVGAPIWHYFRFKPTGRTGKGQLTLAYQQAWRPLDPYDQQLTWQFISDFSKPSKAKH